jgi:hypothetical protein
MNSTFPWQAFLANPRSALSDKRLHSGLGREASSKKLKYAGAGGLVFGVARDAEFAHTHRDNGCGQAIDHFRRLHDGKSGSASSCPRYCPPGGKTVWATTRLAAAAQAPRCDVLKLDLWFGRQARRPGESGFLPLKCSQNACQRRIVRAKRREPRRILGLLGITSAVEEITLCVNVYLFSSTQIEQHNEPFAMVCGRFACEVLSLVRSWAFWLHWRTQVPTFVTKRHPYL